MITAARYYWLFADANRSDWLLRSRARTKRCDWLTTQRGLDNARASTILPCTADLAGLAVFDCFCFFFLDFSSLADDPVVPDLSCLVPGVSIFFVVLVQLLKSLGETSAVYIKITYPCMTR